MSIEPLIPIATFSGRLIDLDRFAPADVDVGDIAHALSMVCRWSGHTTKFYSVAEHSVRVSVEVELAWRTTTTANASELRRLACLDGLLHDAAEAYPPGDIAAPLKRRIECEQRATERDLVLGLQHNVDQVIRKRFSLGDESPPSVKRADRVLLATEARDLVNTDWQPEDARPLAATIDAPWPPQVAELRFLLRFQQLVGAGHVLEAVDRLVPDVGDPDRWYSPDTLMIGLLARELVPNA